MIINFCNFVLGIHGTVAENIEKTPLFAKSIYLIRFSSDLHYGY